MSEGVLLHRGFRYRILSQGFLSHMGFLAGGYD